MKLFSKNLYNFSFISCLQNFLTFISFLEKETDFSKELKMRTCLINWRQSHNKDTAWFLI